MGFMARLQKWPERWEEKGRIEEARENLRSLIKLKFGESPQWVENRMEQADHSQLKAWMDKILFADSLDEMFKR